jgi:hypothetical protein
VGFAQNLKWGVVRVPESLASKQEYEGLPVPRPTLVSLRKLPPSKVGAHQLNGHFWIDLSTRTTAVGLILSKPLI